MALKPLPSLAEVRLPQGAAVVWLPEASQVATSILASTLTSALLAGKRDPECANGARATVADLVARKADDAYDLFARGLLSPDEAGRFRGGLRVVVLPDITGPTAVEFPARDVIPHHGPGRVPMPDVPAPDARTRRGVVSEARKAVVWEAVVDFACDDGVMRDVAKSTLVDRMLQRRFTEDEALFADDALMACFDEERAGRYRTRLDRDGKREALRREFDADVAMMNALGDRSILRDPCKEDLRAAVLAHGFTTGEFLAAYDNNMSDEIEIADIFDAPDDDADEAEK